VVDLVAIQRVQEVRDLWDWIVIGLALAAGLLAVIGLWTWQKQLRQTAEVRFEWWGPGGHRMDVAKPFRFRTGSWRTFTVAIWNVGTGYPGRVVVNVIVPEWLSLRMVDDNGVRQDGRPGDEVAVNCPPNRVKWCVRRTEDFTPAQVVVFDFEVAANEVPSCAADHQHYMAASVEAYGLSPRGKRRAPAWAHAVDDDFWRQEKWPGGRYRRTLRVVEALPAGNVRCGPNKRLDRRPFEVVARTDSIMLDTLQDGFTNSSTKPARRNPKWYEWRKKRAASNSDVGPREPAP